MFGIEGQRDLTERTLAHLPGWRSSRPGRVGNGAWDQIQLDVYGELLAAVHRLSEQIGELGAAERRFLVGLADAAARRWQDTDQGIWEIRGEPQHHVYSKLMCWVALECAIDLAPGPAAEDHIEGWRSTADEIRAAILTEGWNEEVGAFTQAFGSEELDAAVLALPMVGFLPGDDPRIVAAIEAIEAGLTDERGLVYRYRRDDGLEGEKGTFLLCTFWLAEAWARAGRVEHAREVFERAVSFVTTSSCWPRRSIRPAVNCSATSPRRSATSDSSTRPRPLTRPNGAGRTLDGRQNSDRSAQDRARAYVPGSGMFQRVGVASMWTLSS
jgi:alpha,alpha-trehalase